MKNNIKVSIVVPVFNTEKYLRKCIDSLLNQDYQNIEVLLVDDGSTDNSGTICKEYIKKDKRIKYTRTPNMGVSHARNVGIKASTGEYLMFVDSDDYIQSKTILTSVEFAAKNNLDLVRFGMQQEYNNRFYRINDSKGTVVINDLNLIYDDLIKSYKYSSACLEIIRKKTIKDLEFDETMVYGEDYCFNLHLFPNIKKMGIINENFYIYKHNPYSATNYNNSPKKLLNKITSCKKCYSFLIEFAETYNLKDYYVATRQRYLREIINCFNSAIGTMKKEQLRCIYNDIIQDKIVKELIENNNLDSRGKEFVNSFSIYYYKRLFIAKTVKKITPLVKYYILGGTKCEKYNNNFSR